MQRICDFISKWMGVIVLLVAALSLFVPSSLVWIGTWVINPMLGVIMFGMGLTLSAQDLKIVLARPKDILIGCLTQFTVMPLLAWALTKVFSLPQEIAIGVILVGCCPGGTASNVITYLAKGDLALSVGMTAASTLLAPILTPLLVWLLAGTMVDVHTTGMLLSIVYIVILPILCGLLCQRFIPKLTQRVTPYLPAFSSLAVALTVGIVVSHNADRLMTAGLLVVLVVMLHNLFGLGIGYLVGYLLRLPRPKSVALSIEVGMQNSGLATSLAVMHFAAFPLATIPGAVFSVWHNISGAIIARIYARVPSINMETTTSALPERILYLCTCVAWAAKGDLEHLETAVPQALDHGVTINELKDAFAQLYAYAGFPRSLNALGVLEKILNAPMVNGKWSWGKPFVRPAVWDDAGEALRTGTAMQTRDEGGTPWDYTFCPQADYYMKSHLFGDIYASDQLTPAVRELVTVAALSAMDGVTPQFEGHKECAVFMGNTPEQVAELCRWLEKHIK